MSPRWTVQERGRASGSPIPAATLAIIAALLGCSGSTASPSVATVTVTPATTGLTVGASAHLSAAAADGGGNPIQGPPVFWNTADSTVATVSAAGEVTARHAGTTRIAASIDGHSGFSQVTVAAPSVASVSVLPASVALPSGATVQLRAIPATADGTPLTGHSASWSSGNTTVATVDAAGNVTTNDAGTATITATVDGKHGAATVTVTRDTGKKKHH